MKIYEKKENEFKPIVLVLETEEEAENLWHLLNIEDDETLKEYCHSGDLDSERISAFVEQTLDSLDRFVDLSEE